MTNPAERRRSPRVDLVGQIRGELISVELPIVVREISLGGMSIETSAEFDVDTRHDFVLTLGDGAGVFVKGRVAYSRRIERPGGPVFVSGIQFVDDDPQAEVGDLVRRVQ